MAIEKSNWNLGHPSRTQCRWRRQRLELKQSQHSTTLSMGVAYCYNPSNYSRPRQERWELKIFFDYSEFEVSLGYMRAHLKTPGNTLYNICLQMNLVSIQ